jgi:DNA-3-methyladenine glycosylase II
MNAVGGLVSLNIVQPYDFGLSLRVINSFQPAVSKQADVFRIAAKIEGVPVLIVVGPDQRTGPGLTAVSTPEVNPGEVRRIAEWVLFAELDLVPFYSLAGRDPRVASLTHRLHGLKPVRPASLFEMAVIAITEQQISLAAAYSIRARVIQRYGQAVDSLWVFPEPQVLARAPLEELRSLGLSRQKARYIHELAARVAGGELDLELLKSKDDESVRQLIMSWRGFGRWSADYILVRGLARPDCVPLDDLGIRSVVGEYLGSGQRVTADETGELLEPFRPYRGLLAFYLLADYRLRLTAGRSSG